MIMKRLGLISTLALSTLAAPGAASAAGWVYVAPAPRVYTRPAPRHGGALLTPLDPACTAIFNVLEMPGTVVPTGFAESGLPVAVQILSVPGADHVTLAAAQVVEDHLGGWQRATVA